MLKQNRSSLKKSHFPASTRSKINFNSTQCVWCGKKGKKTYHERVVWEELDSTWYRCAQCDSLMILPRPSEKEIAKVYETNYLSRRLQPQAGVDSRIRFSNE